MPRWAPGPAPHCPATDQSPLPVSLFHGVPWRSWAALQGRSFASFLVVSWPSVLFITFPLVGHFHCVLPGCYSTSIYKGWCGTGRCQVVYLGSVQPQAPCGSLPWQQPERPASLLPLFLITPAALSVWLKRDVMAVVWIWAQGPSQPFSADFPAPTPAHINMTLQGECRPGAASTSWNLWSQTHERVWLLDFGKKARCPSGQHE